MEWTGVYGEYDIWFSIKGLELGGGGGIGHIRLSCVDQDYVFYLHISIAVLSIYLQCKVGKVGFPTKYIIKAISEKPLHENWPWRSHIAHYGALATTLQSVFGFSNSFV